MLEENAYHRLCAYTLQRGDATFIHQHVVDAFAAQRAGRRSFFQTTEALSRCLM